MGSRANRTLAIVVGGIVVLAVVAAIFSATRPASSFDQATPQGTVQAYLRAVFKGDHEEAARFLDPAGSCDVEDLDRNGTVDSPRVVLRETSTQADSSTGHRAGGPLVRGRPLRHLRGDRGPHLPPDPFGQPVGADRARRGRCTTVR